VPRLTCTSSGRLERQQSVPQDDLKVIATNTLVNTLVHKYWSNDLEVIEMRGKANKIYSDGKLEVALELYNRAFKQAPNDHLILSNRSITHLKLGNFREAYEDADLAVALRPDWAKGYLRKGSALRLLGHHQDAFKAFFSCLLLEEGNPKPVKQELAKELHQILKNAAANKPALTSSSLDHYDLLKKDGDEDSLSDSDSSSSSDQPCQNHLFAIDEIASPVVHDRQNHIFAIDDGANDPSVNVVTTLTSITNFKPSDLPNCLKELGAFLDGNGETESAAKLKILKSEDGFKWLHVDQVSDQRLHRELDAKAVDASDYECPLCMRLLWKPITTPCGHTFCKTCLDRVLDHNASCPMCKSATLKNYLSERRESTVNFFVEFAMKVHLPQEYHERMKIHEAEMKQLAGETGESSSVQVPIFVCTQSFPSVPCPLHVFEPRYRLMIRRCMEVGTREFGMCCNADDGKTFSDYGTMLEIRDIQFFPDGRSIVDTMGGRRFKVIERNILDGYNTAKVEFIEDEPVLPEHLQELTQLHDDTLQQTKDWFENSGENRRKSIIDHYGKLPDLDQDYWILPNGPTWLWWILNILPIDPKLKTLLLSITSLKKRLENTRRILRFLAKAKSQKNN